MTFTCNYGLISAVTIKQENYQKRPIKWFRKLLTNIEKSECIQDRQYLINNGILFMNAVSTKLLRNYKLDNSEILEFCDQVS